MITGLTKVNEFTQKIEDETEELHNSYYRTDSDIFDSLELADVIIVCLNMAEHYDIDIQKALEEKTLYNESRKD